MPVPPLTLLVITPLSGNDGLSLSPYSARGLDQTLEPILQNTMGRQVRRDINGGMMDLTYDQFQKYMSTITCTDQAAPAFRAAWLGQIVEVACAAELNYLTSTGSADRSEVSGSSRTEGDYTFYRPLLTMMITNIKNSFLEWPSQYRWQIDLQET